MTKQKQILNTFFLKLLFLIFSFASFSQSPSKPDKIKLISISDTVIFTVDLSGCFSAGITVYKLIRLKTKERNVLCIKKNGTITKKISQKNYEAFIQRFKTSAFKFMNVDESGKVCTTISKFYLSNKKESFEFTNNTCEAEFDPEEFLKLLIK